MPSVNVVLTDAVSFPPAFNVTCDEESSLTGTASPAPARRDKTKMWEIISTDMSLGQVTATKKELTGVQRKRLIMILGRGEIAYLRGSDSQSLVMAKEAFHFPDLGSWSGLPKRQNASCVWRRLQLVIR